MTAPHMPMMNDEGLLECPFCNSPDVDCLEYDDGWHAECNECDARSKACIDKMCATRKWNTRNGHLYTAGDFNQAAEERDYGL